MFFDKTQDLKVKINSKIDKLIFSHSFWTKIGAVMLVPSIFGLLYVFIYSLVEFNKQEIIREARDKNYFIERGAEDDAEDLALSQNQVVNYVRCFQRASGSVTCIVHTPPADVRATCIARSPNQVLVDGRRCRWDNPSIMAHP